MIVKVDSGYLICTATVDINCSEPKIEKVDIAKTPADVIQMLAAFFEPAAN
jgi:hypothetical protein